MAKRIRILIADDQPIFRLGLRNLLEADPGLAVVGEVSNAAQAVARVRACRADVLLMSADHSRMATLTTLRELARLNNQLRTVVMCNVMERSAVVPWLELGARGVVLRDSASHLMVRCVHKVAEGQYWVGREVVLDLVETMRRQIWPAAATGQADATPRLTARELNIVECIMTGVGNKEIAERFSISEHTVKHHLTRIFHKTGASSRLELAVFALKHFLRRDDGTYDSPGRTA